MASRWRHCAGLTGPGIEPQTSRTDSVRLATELTAGSHQCSTCDKLWYERNHFLRHCKKCAITTRQTYPGSVFKCEETIFEKLVMIGIIVPLKDRYFPYFACFDFECYFDTANLPKNGPHLAFQARHVALSFAISSNVPGFQDGVCHVTDGDETVLIS